MDSNTFDKPTVADGAGGGGRGLAAQDLDRLADAALAEQVLEQRRLLDQLEGHWLRGWRRWTAGAPPAPTRASGPSTAGWLRDRLRMGAAPRQQCPTARALVPRGPVSATALALTAGEISAHASVLAHGTQELAAHVTAEAEPVLLEAARAGPPRLRRAVAHLRRSADPEGAEDRAARQHQQRGLWLSRTIEGMVALNGLLEPEAGQILQSALEPWPAPQRRRCAAAANARPMPSPSWPAATWKADTSPRPVGSDPS